MCLRVGWCQSHVCNISGSTLNVKTSLRLFCVLIGHLDIRPFRSYESYTQMSGIIWAFCYCIKCNSSSHLSWDIAISVLFQPCVLWRCACGAPGVPMQILSGRTEELIPSVTFDADSEYVSVGLVRSILFLKSRDLCKRGVSMGVHSSDQGDVGTKLIAPFDWAYLIYYTYVKWDLFEYSIIVRQRPQKCT